jgi:6-phosphogluconolactonase (cycloisomerase 2 family)
MTNHLNRVVFLTFTLCPIAFTQTASTSPSEKVNASAGESAVAYVYVSSRLKGGSVNEIEAFAASPGGKLTVVQGSPFDENVTSMAVNGKYLFGANSNGIEIESYWIESNGALRYAKTTHMAQSNDCNVLGPLFFDRTGSSLYDMEYDGSSCANNTYESLAVEKSTGGLKELGNSSGNDWLYLPATFVGNNIYAYSASCLDDMYWGIFGFERAHDGLLTEISIEALPPKPPQGYFYCPSQATADQADHVAISMQPVNQQTFTPDKPARLAVYTAEANGNLTTTNTHSNMPETFVGSVTDLRMSPSGMLLAVGGTGGLQVFHVDGSDPIKPYTDLLTKNEIDQFFWDNQNHLYAISRSADKLFVFTITPTSHSEASDSPYTINRPQNIIVQPLP